MNLSDDEYRDHVTRLRQAINAAPSSAYSHVAHAGTVNGYSPERHAAHEAILDDAWSELGGDTIPKGRQGLILGGTPGSGKTSVRESASVPGVGPVKSGFLPIDSDYFKGKLIDAGLAPSLRGFSPMEAAPLMHKESNDIAKKFAQRAYDQGTNLAWDYTLRHSTSGPNRLKEFGRYDYTPHGIYVHANPDDALSRVTNRHRDDLGQYMEGLHRHGGRYVPPEIITDSVHGNRIANRDNYDAIAPWLSSSQVFNTSARTAQTRTVPDPKNPRALIVVDVQNDFVNGSLPVGGGTEAATKIGQALRGEDPDLHHGAYHQVISTQDWHHDPGDHFSDNPDYVNTWPVHCKAGTPGSELHPALQGGRIDHQFHKGHYSAAYSGFEGQHAQTGSNLTDHLRNSGIGHVDVCGIATDHCVKATALDAAKNGFKTRVLLPYTAAVSDDGLHGALGELRNAGVEIVGNTPAQNAAKQAARRIKSQYDDLPPLPDGFSVPDDLGGENNTSGAEPWTDPQEFIEYLTDYNNGQAPDSISQGHIRDGIMEPYQLHNWWQELEKNRGKTPEQLRDERQQSKNKAKELADGLWNTMYPPEEEEGRKAVQGMDTVNKLMDNGWQPEHIKYNDDDEPYAHYQHPSGWNVTDHGGMYKEIGHAATPGESHDVINVSRNVDGQDYHDPFGPADAHNHIENELHGDPEETGGMFQYLTQNDSRINQYKPRQASRHRTAATSGGGWYHVTHQKLSPGDRLVPGGGDSHWTDDNSFADRGNHVWLSDDDEHVGYWLAQFQRGEKGKGPPRLYEVNPDQPPTPYDDDPLTGQVTSGATILREHDPLSFMPWLDGHRTASRLARHLIREAGYSDQPDDVTNDYSLAEFFQWCAHNRKDADRDSLAQYAAVSGMDTENYLDIYLFLSDDKDSW